MAEVNCGTEAACEACPLNEYPTELAQHLGRIADQLSGVDAGKESFIMASRMAGDGPAELTPEMVDAAMQVADMLSPKVHQ